MKKQRIGRVLFWIGVIGMFTSYFLIWISAHYHRQNTPETLIGTGWAPYEPFFLIISLAMLIGFSFSLIGALLYSREKKSFFWLWSLVPIVGMIAAEGWKPSLYIPVIYGIGAGIITLAYLGLLWISIRKHGEDTGIARIGKHIQLLSYSFLYLTALLLCGYISDIHLAGTGYQRNISSYSILITFSLGWALLFAGNYISAKDSLIKK